MNYRDYMDITTDLETLKRRQGEYPGTVRLPERYESAFGQQDGKDEYYGSFKKWCQGRGIVLELVPALSSSVYQVP